ncbi:hypothetical protein KSS87_001399 [Heliosperma pusillum]|nr:hypothetical protein KSS87_001399 [Heliosperma pusillum]
MNYDRQMKGEDLDELSVEELSQLERQIDKAYTRIRRVKDAKLQKVITDLKHKVSSFLDSLISAFYRELFH